MAYFKCQNPFVSAENPGRRAYGDSLGLKPKQPKEEPPVYPRGGDRPRAREGGAGRAGSGSAGRCLRAPRTAPYPPPPPGASSHPTPPPSRPAPHPPRAWDSDPGLAWAEGPAGLGGKGACARGSRASGRGDVPPTPAGFPSGSVPRRSAPRQLTPKKSP